jgi:hypothetical protein
MIETVLSCPLGSKCEEIKDGKLVRCRAYTQVSGRHPQTGEDTNDWKCSVFEWQPILLLEIARTNMGQTAAIESFRNDTVMQTSNALTSLMSYVPPPKLIG